MNRINFEAFVIAHLNAQGFDAFADVPDGKLVSKPSEFVTVEQTGGGSNGVAIGTVTLAVQSWAPSRYEASQLAADVDAAADYSVEWAATMTEWVANVLLSSFYFSSAVAEVTTAAAANFFIRGDYI